ncbi:hypothetical protein DDE82_003190 [Stemphylium lycopersici]|uniref:Uncharacterized protein n=1 Tax=Stemphylium lycopersici TaxID=183478 RepID=A0A364N3N7_STELY|nr:hypothetical protein DDE82_003190 [Stemphylium lycopersici]RAR11035.1 hypothetical protein DDE83_004793 [Stemphylium lycopersici]
MKRPVVPVGHHLIWFNPTLPTHDLLPDGTDASHSPGGPWVRRMWAGGSVRVKPHEYHDKSRGFTVGTQVAGIERIKDVQLRGQGDAAKVFVTIERCFTRVGTKWGSLKKYHKAQMSNGHNWADAFLREERNLVFLKERTADELDALKTGNIAPVKYLASPTEPTFSHSLTPNRALLFRFSALTFNAHLIHLDPNYARNVEGHRNLLVHGPLSLLLMLQVMNNYIHTHTKGVQTVESIEYRNLAPLYCDEEMRICGSEKTTLKNGSVYDIWIEGPTGGMAVKGTVYTTVRKSQPPPVHAQEKRGEKNAKNQKATQPSYRRINLVSTKPDPTAKKEAVEQQSSSTSPTLQSAAESAVTNSENSALDQSTSEGPQSTSPTSVHQPSTESEGENSQNPTLNETSSQSSSREAIASPTQLASHADRRRKATRVKNHKFIIPSKPSPPIRPVEPYILGRPFMSAQSRHLLRRLLREPMPQATDHTVPLLTYRKYAASPYTPNPARTASRHSRFLRQGVRRFERPSIRAVGPPRTRSKMRNQNWDS